MLDIKVAFILPSLANRGPIVFTKYLAEELSKYVRELNIYYLDDVKSLSIACPCYKVSKFSEIPLHNYDIVHTTMFRPDLFSVVNRVKTKGKYKIVSGIHNHIQEDMIFNYGSIKGKIISYIWEMALNKFDGVIYSSDMMSKYYSSRLKVSGYTIPYGITDVKSEQYNAIDELDRLKLEELRKNYKVIGSVGLLIERKGFHQIIESLVHLPNIALVIIGEGPERERLEKLIHERNLTNRVLLLGFKDRSKDYYCYFDMYCLSSYSEGFGLAMLEGLASSMPLICSKLDIYEEYFKDTDVSKFELNNTDSLVKAIKNTVNNLDFYAQKSRGLYEKYFHVSKMAKTHLIFYDRVLNE